jgi:hypothetical protein
MGAGKIEQCAEEIKASTSCYERQNFTTEACRVAPGTLPNGAPCDVSTQCASSYCEFEFGLYPDGGLSLPFCGACAPGAGPPRCGDAGPCQSPQRCLHDRDEDREHCVIPQREGAPCVSPHGCEDGLFCQRPPSGDGIWVARDKEPWARLARITTDAASRPAFGASLACARCRLSYLPALRANLRADSAKTRSASRRHRFRSRHRRGPPRATRSSMTTAPATKRSGTNVAFPRCVALANVVYPATRGVAHLSARRRGE